ncbi:MAG: BtaA family protein [Pyrinomonadaceae bacterium]
METTEHALSIGQAVAKRPVTTKEGILQRLFAIWFDAFVYNQIWEDPAVDLEALELDSESRVLTISSGGCNALNYLLHGPESVTAVDLNKNHISLLNLKIAATTLDHSDFFGLFGEGINPRAQAIYSEKLRPRLDEETKAFWDSRTWLKGISFGPRIRIFEVGGLYEHSRNAYFLRFFHRFARLLGSDPSKLLEAHGESEQIEIYRERVEPFFNTWFVWLVGRLPITLFGLGIPPQQYKELVSDLKKGGGIIDVYRERARKLGAGFPIEDNYFAWQAFGRRYDTKDRKALPEYLKEENFQKLRDNIGRLETSVCSVTRKIRESEVGRFNRFVFLDAQDWMDETALNGLWTSIAEKAENGARIIFRTASSKSPVESMLGPEVRARFVYHKELSKALFERDRASIYGGFHLYELRK